MACRHAFKLFKNQRIFYKLVNYRVTPPVLAPPTLGLCPKKWAYPKETGFAVGLSLLSWLGFEKDDEEKESELIMTLKRAVLCTQREQYEKAEQMLHLALRLAQQQQNQQGVIYCYDLMANLALDTFQLDKAEKLFVSVLQLLLGGGLDQKDLKVIHISLKLARISQLKAEIEKADLGYKWCLEQIETQKNDSVDAQMLYGVIQDWYSQFLLDVGDVKQALIHLREAYNACKRTKGRNSEQSMLLLNDLGTTSFRAGDIDNAQGYLKEAITVGREVEDKSHLGVIHANLGLILLEKGVAKEAEKYCKEAWKLGKKFENNESVEQANYCFDQIKLVLGK
ncbi:tetratricopeptide repeat protein 19 homolog, mitochondrial [Tribolium castaneum]|uniref:tetratricopeptide repeat protein 19 homolog, mitochondrial n=1 Tax=Tribolium castaneum TaxID=7070 RepID=UPI0000D561BF|nr:PREDICTED: tetratricopeptide repeat protein 19 homolog, mitochondrial [Tribolium castaneum]|eukprot:XP_974176.1 PREDICTED: tetratricopeptide repeat protein 19 homolog, mitochondrial [Tribolium castaneum]